jgi:hypothetical protein
MSEEEDISNSDPFIGGGEHGFIGKAKSCYIMVFENEEQLNRLYELLKIMRRKHKDIRTHGERIDLVVQKALNEYKNAENSI